MSDAARLDPVRMAFYVEAEIDALRIRAVHELCVIAGSAGREIEFVERGINAAQALHELHEAAFGRKVVPPFPRLLDADFRTALWADDKSNA